MQTVHIGMVGLGTVGTGVAKLLLKNRSALTHKTGVEIALKKVCVAHLDKPRDVALPPEALTDRLDDILSDQQISAVVEVVGGIDTTRGIVERIIDAGKHVVTANKALLALHGRELFERARRKGVSISFEASVAGGVPIIASLRDSFAANTIESIFGIVNGTSNYILTKMSRADKSYDAALAEAQEKGYAEKDPTLDVCGTDSAHKLAVLARVAFDAEFDYQDIHVEGIEGIRREDIQHAQAMGYTLKLLAIAKASDGAALDLRVHPTLLPDDHPLSSVHDEFNAISVSGDALGETMLYGRGAGQMPTASAVVADLIDVVLGRARIAFDALRMFRTRAGKLVPKPIGEIEARYYVHFTLVDQPGVLAKIAGVLGRLNISIASVNQQERRAGTAVPAIMMTHHANEANMQTALTEIEQLEAVLGKPRVIRVEG